MTIGWWLMGFGVLVMLAEQPGLFFAVLAVGIMPFLIVRSTMFLGIIVLLVYGGSVALIGMQLFPLADNGTNLLYLLALPAVMIASWGYALDG